MTNIKMNRALKLAGIAGIAGMTQTAKHILQHLEESVGSEVFEKLTSKQIADLMKVSTYCYHQGRASMNAEVVDGDAVWVGAGVDKMIPLAALRSIKIETSTEIDPPKPAAGGYTWPASQFRVTRYSMDFVERI
jgi:hypothetical protein